MTRSAGYAHLAKLVLAIAAVATAAKAVQLGLSNYLLDTDAAAALNVDPLNTAAILRLPATDSASDLAHLRTLLRQRPSDGRLFRRLAQRDASDPQRTEQRMQAALQLRPADVETRGWMADYSYGRGNLTAAVQHVDAILRVAPLRAEHLFPILLHWLGDTQADAAFVQALGEHPPWREGFIHFVAREGQVPALYALARVIQGLRSTSGPAAVSELRPVINRLVHEADYDRAYLLWRGNAAAPVNSNIVHNGDFETPATSIAFDWTLPSTPGAQVSREQDPAHATSALRVRFDDRRVSDIGIAQTVLLAAGHYRLRGETRLDRVRSARGLAWEIRCLPAGKPLSSDSERLQGSRDWSTFDVAFTVPADCPAQRVYLSTRARIAAEQQVDGTAWFDNLRIEAGSSR